MALLLKFSNALVNAHTYEARQSGGLQFTHHCSSTYGSDVLSSWQSSSFVQLQSLQMTLIGNAAGTEKLLYLQSTLIQSQPAYKWILPREVTG